MTSLDLGSGHSLRWVSWSCDRDLNPQYAALPDVPRYGAIVRHPLREGDDNATCQGQGYCEGVIIFDGPVACVLDTGRARWNVASWEPLTLAPSLLCHCGDHGFIIDGRWQDAG